jgi:hypothetical protein
MSYCNTEKHRKSGAEQKLPEVPDSRPHEIVDHGSGIEVPSLCATDNYLNVPYPYGVMICIL